jgi:hypothetical protein
MPVESRSKRKVKMAQRELRPPDEKCGKANAAQQSAAADRPPVENYFIGE